MEPFRVLTGRTVVLPLDDVDTDQIIPARFLKGTTRTGLGRGLFADRRYSADGSPRPDFPLNRAEAAGAPVLVTGRNFGCGSSREHAVWALADQGFRALICPASVRAPGSSGNIACASSTDCFAASRSPARSAARFRALR